MLTFGSLFAGIGGFDLGFEQAGLRCQWQVEKDEWCQRVLAKHWPDVPRYGDIQDVGKANLEPVDIIIGGFPCQPFSDAGQRRGAADDRFLWPEMLRIIAEMRPRWVVGENVPGFISLYLDQAIFDLETLGYKIGPPVVLPAVGFDADHLRYRVFIVAYVESLRLQRGNQLRDSDRRKRTGVWDEFTGSGQQPVVSNAQGHRLERDRPAGEQIAEARQCQRELEGGLSAVGHANGHGWHQLEQQNSRGASGQGPISSVVQPGSTGERWPTEPGVGRVADGVPHRVDRLRGLGNAVVPRVARHIAELIIQVEGLITKGYRT